MRTTTKEMMEKTCPGCQTSFTCPEPGRRGNRVFCTSDCYHAFQASKRQEAICLFCQAPFSYLKAGTKTNTLYCSAACYRKHLKAHGGRRPEALKPHAIFTCKHCQKEFTDLSPNPTRSRIFCSIDCRAQWHAINNPEWRAKLSANTANRPRGPRNPRWGKSPLHGKGFWYERTDGQRIFLRSGPERIVADYLTSLGVAWEYEARRFVLEDRTYCPDFWIPEWGCYWEVKGWFHARHQETIRQFRHCHPAIPIVVITPPWYGWMERQLRQPIQEAI
jgi:hypothetical protein